MSEKKIKVTDKRMFTPDGELKEEFRHLNEEPEGTSPAKAAPEPSAPQRAAFETGSEAASSASARVEIPPTADGPGQPTFFDLVGLVAQPIALYLGEAKMPDGESLENLELARLHIDLLEILRTKTSGNLTAQELSFIDDLLYQFRLRYVQKRG